MKLRTFGSCSAVLLILAACGGTQDYSSITAPPPEPPPVSPPVSPPVESVFLSGSWTGTYTAEPLECESSHGPASAELTQVGSSVSGTLTGASPYCGFAAIRFEGTLEGDRLAGEMVGFFPNAHIEGSVTNQELFLTVLNVYNYPQGQMLLRR